MSKNLWHDVETGIDVPEIINVIVEIPKGSQNKYEYDKKHNMVKLDRVLFSPFHYPGDYGWSRRPWPTTAIRSTRWCSSRRPPTRAYS